jgi:HPt (histidine-containing phosphotransfer) domain-containing protein
LTHISELDPAALGRLEALGGPGLARKIIGIFLSEGPRRLADARAALGRRDADALGLAVHALISSAGNVGAMGLAEFARLTEHEADGGRWDGLAERLERMTEAFDTIRVTLEAQRDGRA